jgi:predicted dehydrogenase
LLDRCAKGLSVTDLQRLRVRIGVLGCGQIAQAAHFEACRKAANAELYAICDAAEDLLAEMRAMHHPRAAYRDYDAMLADPNVDAVIVAIADQFHVSAAARALAAGKHVLVEKPLGVTVEECEELKRLVDASGLVLQVGTMKRFDPGVAFARRFIREEMGQILAMKAWYCDSTYRYAMTDALQPIIASSASAKRPAGDPKADRRRYYLLGHGSHLVDTARFLVGEIESVRATLVEKFGAYCWFVEAAFADGSVGHLDLTVAVRMDWHEGFEVRGEHGSALGTIYNPWYLKSADVECFSTRDGQYHRPLGADAHHYRRQVEGFADAILTGAPMQGAAADDGLAAIRALVAIARAAETGERVRLADVTGEP